MPRGFEVGEFGENFPCLIVSYEDVLGFDVEVEIVMTMSVFKSGGDLIDNLGDFFKGRVGGFCPGKSIMALKKFTAEVDVVFTTV